ncbi:hypothetical protein PtB15_18B176 [Puccinia triticina]|nr:hypothetical protein PtB15_18B176 [Puccinia triticina]
MLLETAMVRLENIQAMVESWLPKELQAKSTLEPSESTATLHLNSLRPRNSK